MRNDDWASLTLVVDLMIIVFWLIFYILGIFSAGITIFFFGYLAILNAVFKYFHARGWKKSLNLTSDMLKDFGKTIEENTKLKKELKEKCQ